MLGARAQAGLKHDFAISKPRGRPSGSGAFNKQLPVDEEIWSAGQAGRGLWNIGSPCSFDILDFSNVGDR
jgi:hypothetical protein